MVMRRRIVAVLVFLLPVLLATISTSQTPNVPSQPGLQAQARPDIEQMRQELGLIEAQLQRDGLTDSELERLRVRLVPIFEGVQAIIARETPKLEEINARLDRIGPPPKDKEPPESAEVVKNRAEQDRLKKEVDEIIRVARLAQVRAEQAQAAVTDYRRRLFAQELLNRSESILSPWLWIEAFKAIPAAVGDFHALLTFRIRQAAGEIDTPRVMGALAILVLALASYSPARRILLHRFDAFSSDTRTIPTRGQRATGALRGTFLRVLVPLLVAFVLSSALHLLGFGADRLGEFFRFCLFSLPVMAGLRGLAVGILQPDRPAWRVAKIEQKTAEHLFPALWAMLLVVLGGKLIEAASQSIAAALPMTVVVKGLTSILAAIVLIRALRRIDAHQDAQEETLDEFGPAVAAHAGNTFAIILKIAGWIMGATVIGAALFGYVALATFLIDLTIWLLIVGGIIALLLIAVDEFLAKGTAADSALTRQIRASTGIAPSSIRQIGILSSGLMQFLLYILAGLLALAPFGINSGDLFGSLRTAVFGFQIGGVTISIFNIALSITVFVVLVLIVRAIQRWVEHTFLPSTSLDAGLQNSITMIIGYAGFLFAAVLAMSYLGLSLDRIAIVAGALSVGLGFGLQSIVSNFVSGLILLWERPIKVGDLIVVGPDTGRVRRINVRSTEIETADRSSLIVPNSEFISGKVKNMMHANRIARVVIPLAVSTSADPHQIRKELLESANAHLEVMTSPEAGVVFLDVTPTALTFELRCFVDIDAQISVRSDLMFDIYERMRKLGVLVPPPKEPLGLADLEALSNAARKASTNAAPKS
jgi:small-conductance mechanosensitive channel